MPDSLSRHLVRMVRQMPDEAILSLVRDHLGVPSSVTPSYMPVRPAPGKRASSKRPSGAPAKKRASAKRPSGAPAKKRAPAKRPSAVVEKTSASTKRTSAAKRAPTAVFDERVAAVVKSKEQGLALQQVADAVEASKPRVSAALRRLRDAGAIAMAGDRRFARYGATAAAAEKASLAARGAGSTKWAPAGDGFAVRRGRRPKKK